MNLNYTDLGHFINQLSIAVQLYGFSEQDSQTLSGGLNNQYNVRCAPAVSENGEVPQLLSLCQAETCPLAVPSADCAAYVNLSANDATAAASAASSPVSQATLSSTADARTSSPASASSTTLTNGSIAGISIAAIALLLAVIGAVLFYLRRQRSAPEAPVPPYPAAPVPEAQQATSSECGTPIADNYKPSPIGDAPAAEMESPQFPGSPEMGSQYRYWAEHNRYPYPHEKANMSEMGVPEPRDGGSR